jgi:predicted DCC family thiol-disulfide oxidoreductase YuxK
MQTTLYYDGDCPFCTACARLVERFDRQKKIQLVPLQNSEHADCEACYDTILFVRGDYQSRFSRAVIDVCYTLGGFWWFLGGLIWLVPRPIRDWLYRVVGRNRYLFVRKNTVTKD